MDTSNLVILASRRDAQESAITGKLKAIWRHLALRDRGTETPGGAQDHLALSRFAQSPARGSRRDQRLNQYSHGGIGGIDIMRGHVAQCSRGPQRAPARANCGDKVRLALDAQKAFELASETGSKTIFYQRRRSHHDGSF